MWERSKRLLKELLPLAVLLVGRASFADHYRVPTPSMEPTIHVSDHLVVDKRAYGLRVPLTHVWLWEREPERGDVVVFDSPVDERVWVKRVVAVPGDRIAFDGQKLILNGIPVEQRLKGELLLEAFPGAEHTLMPGLDQGPTMTEQVVPAKHYVVMGDNRGNSADSRSWGLLSRERVLGRVVWVL